MADCKIAGDNISEENSMDASQGQHETIDKMLARHSRLETNQLQNKEVEMKKAAARGSKAEQKAKTKQVEEDISKFSTNLKEMQMKELASQVYNNSSNNSNDRAKEEKSSSDAEWTVILPRKRRHARSKDQEKEGEPWDSDEIDPQRHARLIQNMEITMKKVESSEFYKEFLKQLKSPQVSDHFRLVLGSETQMLMVMYGIGSIESYEPPRFQLSIAILMKREFAIRTVSNDYFAAFHDSSWHFFNTAGVDSELPLLS